MKPPFPCLTRLAVVFAGLFAAAPTALAASAPLSTDRARVTVASIPDPHGGPNLKVLRTDANTPLRAGTAWIWEKHGQEEPLSYYVSMRAKGLNAVRMILFDTWEVETYTPGPDFTPTDWNDAAYRTRQLARMERSVNYASANGMYVIINSHNHIPSYNETYVNALWTHVAPYFANRTHVLYEAANEPMSGIGTNGDMDQGGNAQNSPRLQALKRGYNIIRAGAPDTHIMVLTPPGINDSAYGTGMGNLADSFAALPGTVDWTKTSVAYHLYNNDAAYGVANNAANLRNLHSRYPGWPSENAFPPGDIPGAIGLDQWRSQPFPGDWYVNQTCERLGLGWSMWFINGQNQLDNNFPIMWADAVAKGWNWTPDPPVQNAGVKFARNAPTIDGTLDGAWSAAAANAIGNPVLGSAAPPSNLSGNWRTLWDQNYLYVLVEVTDDVLVSDSGSAWWDDDAVEIYLDANNSRQATYDGIDDCQYVFRWNTATVLESKLARTQGVTFARAATTGGYRLKVRFPWSTLGLTPAAGVKLGIEVMLADDDDGGARERKLAWRGATDNAWQNPSLFGIAELLPYVAPIESIRVNAGGPAVGGFAADSGFSPAGTQGAGAAVSTAGVALVGPAALYDTERWNDGPITYTSPVLAAGQSYEVRLHFAERYVTAAGQRRFHISINGAAGGPNYVADYDVFAAAGNAMNKAVVRSFPNVVPDADGRIAVTLSKGSAQNPMLNGIEILSSFAAWQVEHFTSAELANSALSGPLAMPLSDGVSNLLKFACNIPARQYAPALTTGYCTEGLPVAARQDFGHGRQLVFEFIRRRSTTGPGVTWTPQFSSDLSIWTSDGLTMEVEWIDAAWERIRARETRIPSPPTRGFARLLVTQP